MARVSKAEDQNVVVEVSHADILDDTIHKLAERGFEPVLIAFRDPSGEVEVLTRKIDLAEFASWLLSTWIPASRDLLRGQERGH